MHSAFAVFAIFAMLFVGHVAEAAKAPKPDWSYVQKRLKKAKFKQSFINDLKRIYDHKHFTRVLEFNVLLYLRQTDYHQPQVSREAVNDVRNFLAKNKSAFARAEKLYSVPPPVISSLLWLESRHGQNKGVYHVASVYLHLLQAERPTVVRYLKASVPRYNKKPPKGTPAKVAQRARTKAEWALAELKALQNMYNRDAKLVRELKGSFSGAFGMAQFIPSSYVKFARAYSKKRAPNLTRADDAIMSVAHYLKKSGWKNGKKGTHKKALMKYNNSEDYAKAILSLADRVAPENLQVRRDVSGSGTKAKSTKKSKKKKK